MASPPSKRFYRPELDGLRFFAFLAVYINHTLLLDPGRGELWKRVLGSVGTAGAFGVDLFFALSAYLITELLVREKETQGTVDISAFYVRRMLRIWPLYFVFLGSMVWLARVLPTEQMTAHYAIGLAFFCGNWLYMLHPIRTMAAPLWSVSIEEQFYVLWPWVVRNGSRRRIAVVAVGVLAASSALALALALAGIGEPLLSRNSLIRSDGIAGGALLAAALGGRVPRLAQHIRWTMIASGLAVLVVVAGTFDLFHDGVRLVQPMAGYPLVALSSTALLFAVLGADGGIGRILRRREVVYLGRISYGLYVFHQVGLSVADRLLPGYLQQPRVWAEHFSLGLVVTTLLAAVSYAVLEKPFLRLKQRRFTIIVSQADSPTPGAALATH